MSPSTPEYGSGQRLLYTYEPVTANNRGLLQRIDYVIDGAVYPITFGYDDLGRTNRIDYPNVDGGTPVAAKYTYDDAGILIGLDEVGSGATTPIWHMTEAHQGHLIQKETFGTRASTSYTYDPTRRWLDTLQTDVDSDPVQSLSYTHYKNSQVQLRNTPEASREYVYDQLNRLASINDTPSGGVTTLTGYAYDVLGNMTQRGTTPITYLPSRPHLVDKVGDNTYTYDRIGNVKERSGPDVPGGIQTLTYTPFDLPRTIIAGQAGVTKTTRFEYSADEERLIRRDADITRHFVTDLYQRVLSNQSGATQEETFRLYAGEREVAQIVRQNGTDKKLFFHSDHLGSVDTISTDAGTVTRQAFDAFGTPVDPPDPEITRVGYTGHQHERDLGMIDMRGRMYDTLAGRFMSADPVMQAPHWSQGLNRYAYVFNDPINYTDPSGFDAAAGGGGLIAGLGLGGLGNVAVQGLGMMSAGSLAAGAIGLGGVGVTLGGGIGFGRPGGSSGSTALGTAAPTSGPSAQGGMNATGSNTGLTPPVQEGGISLPPWLDPRNAPRPPDASSPIPPSTDVYIGYTEIGQACNSMSCAHHTFVILRQAGEGTFATRAGPGGPGPAPYGSIETRAGPWNEQFTDTPSETVRQQKVGTVRRSLAELKAHVRAFNDAVDRARVPYSPYGANSNTYSGQFLRSIGVRASPDRWSPGFSGSFNTRLPSIGSAPSWASP